MGDAFFQAVDSAGIAYLFIIACLLALILGAVLAVLFTRWW